jgi:hypothetical protein
MSLSANIDHLAIAAGIEAVVVDTGTREYRGDEQWYRVLDGALDLFRRTDERSIRLVVGKHTIVVQKESDETVAVVLPTGHAIAKSLRRMIRRMARKDRGPIPKDFPIAATPTSPTLPPSSMGMGSSPGVTTPSPSPVSSPAPTSPGQTPPSVAPKTGEEVKPGTASPGTASGAAGAGDRTDRTERSDRSDRGADRGGFHNY